MCISKTNYTENLSVAITVNQRDQPKIKSNSKEPWMNKWNNNRTTCSWRSQRLHPRRHNSNNQRIKRKWNRLETFSKSEFLDLMDFKRTEAVVEANLPNHRTGKAAPNSKIKWSNHSRILKSAQFMEEAAASVCQLVGRQQGALQHNLGTRRQVMSMYFYLTDNNNNMIV